ncbi:hypothetical protein FO440_23795 [Mucilaginibacter corticis]|uniref:Uncharacterized protein n=1 Tax=Mucilaginibacter corticis TaxID=2597670 RepID=A0A556M7T3_9SPHI|nr:hypothetical protein [Mucilaginibacter corticis]TSJ35944.1 hypothetical protein FO440_23795 [Mucilaginibacter corticis]
MIISPMPKFLILAILFVVTEVIIAFLFAVIAQIFYKRVGLDFKAIFKGMAERVFLFILLANGYSSALTFFSALKLATRLKHEEPKQTLDGFNDYYLLGNLLSVAVAIGYVNAFQHIQ